MDCDLSSERPTKKRVKTVKNTTTMIHKLPKDIMFDIFSRLPLGSLSCCSFVCKDWRNLTKNPFLVNLRYNSQISAADDDSGRFIVFARACQPSFYLVDHANLNTCKEFHIQDDVSQQEQGGKTVLLGSSHGLLCLSRGTSFYICNPFTGEVLKLPESPHTNNRDNWGSLDDLPDCYYKRGNLGDPGAFPSAFAFDTTTNTYKLFHTWYFHNDQLREPSSGVEIYTLGGGSDHNSSNSSWRRVDDICGYYNVNLPPTPVFVNGAFHSTIYWNSFHIGVIDVATEKFETFETPLGWFGTTIRTLSLLGESLCLADDDRGKGEEIDLWIMKDYGVESSWTRQYIIRKQTLGPLLQTGKGCFNILTRMKKNKNGSTHLLFLHSDVHQGFYDLEKEEFVPITIKGLPLCSDDRMDKLDDILPPDSSLIMFGSSNRLDVVVHVGSLLSPIRIIAAGDTTGTATKAQLISPRTRPKRKIKKPLRFLT